MAEKAIIMAGGEGVRLRPMTCLLPKPLIPILERPVMEYTLLLLRRHGIRDVSATLCYRGDSIRKTFGDGRYLGMKLHYLQEDTPRGTAGSILPLKQRMKNTFIVLSGDGLTDCDLRDALQFHRSHQALATLILKKVPVPLSYGVVLTDDEGRITRFIEKPGWQNVFSDLVNTGIYIFEPAIFDFIPETGTPDFAKDVFPALLESGQRLCGYEMQGYWCDVGSQQAYLDAQLDLLRGKAALPCKPSLSPNAHIHPTAVLSGHCYIGPDVHIGPGAQLRDAILFSGSQVHARAVVNRSCLWQNAAAGQDVYLNGSVLCDGAAARAESILAENCALGSQSDVGAGSTLSPGVKIYPFFSTPPDSFVRCTIARESPPPLYQRGMTLNRPEDACRLAGAIAAQLRPTKLLLSHTPEDNALADILSGSFCSLGLNHLRATVPMLPMAQFLTSLEQATHTLHISGQQILLLDANGEPIREKAWTALQNSMDRCETPPAFMHTTECTLLSDAEQRYLSAIIPPNSRPASLPVHFKIFCSDKRLLKLCGKALLGAGAKYVSMKGLSDLSLGPQEVGFILHENGQSVLPFTQDLTPTPEQNTLLSLLCCLKSQGVLYRTSQDLPRCAERMTALLPADDSAACVRQRQLLRDGVALCAQLSQLLSTASLEQLLSQLPENYVQEQSIPCPDRDKGRILRTLSRTSLPHQLGEGLHIAHPRGHAAIIPDAHAALVRIRSESRDSEFAKELCDLYSRQVRSILQSPDNGM